MKNPNVSRRGDNMINIHACSDGKNCKCKSQHPEYVKCPFCGEDDFDLIGLKYHLQNYCDPFDECPGIGHKEAVNSVMEVFDKFIGEIKK